MLRIFFPSMRMNHSIHVHLQNATQMNTALLRTIRDILRASGEADRSSGLLSELTSGPAVFQQSL